MAAYGYKCAKCGNKFERILSFKEYKRKQKCPKCGSNKVEQIICSFLALTSKKT